MKLRITMLCGLASCLLGLSPAGEAGETVVKAPFVLVRVAGRDRPAPGVFVQTPFGGVAVPRDSAPPVVVPPPSGPVEVLPPPKKEFGPVDGPEPPIVEVPRPSVPVVDAPVPVRAPTHAEFASAFKPLPGQYEVVLQHPDTHCPVRVCFTLPPGCPRKVRVERHELEFDYGKYEVEIRFKRDGRVSVEYND